MSANPWRHPPGTLRALIATFGDHYVICRPCQRYTPMRVEPRDLDRPYEPCPFRCGLCHRRGEIVWAVPEDFTATGDPLGLPAHRTLF
jgi:hypothetical protein